LGAGFHCLFWLGHLSFNVDDGLIGDGFHKLDHLFRDLVIFGQDTLHGVVMISEYQESKVSLDSGIMDSGSEIDGGVSEGFGEVLDFSVDFGGSFVGGCGGKIAIEFCRVVLAHRGSLLLGLFLGVLGLE
jgi:hypothetical protein